MKWFHWRYNAFEHHLRLDQVTQWMFCPQKPGVQTMPYAHVWIGTNWGEDMLKFEGEEALQFAAAMERYMAEGGAA